MTDNAFVCALRADTLDDTVHIIAAALGLAGGVGGDGMAKDYSFTPRDHETYARLPNAHQRANFIGSWLLAELNEASEVILGGG